MLAYGLYQESLKENFSVEDLMRLVQREGRNVEASAPAVSAADFDPHWEQGGGIDESGRQWQSWDEGEIGRPEVQGSENGSGGLNRRKMPVSLE